MTDGIIQEVLNNYRPLRKPNGNYPYFTPKMFNEIQQELIEKIKKIEHNAKTFREAKILQDYEDKLIGDNQE